MSKKILIAYSYGLEFGWHVIKWQSKVRYYSKNYDEVYIVCDDEYMFLYNDFARNIKDLSKSYTPDMWRFSGCTVDHMYPTKEICCRFDNDKYISYEHVICHGYEREGNKIAIHPRNKNDGREWEKEKWIEYIDCLVKSKPGIKIFYIGKAPGSYYLFNKNTMYGVYAGDSLYMVSRTLSQTRLIIGASSGPLHFASLCGCPQLVWTDKGLWNLGGIKGTNRQRYEKYWNPFHTSVTVIDEYGWNPPVDIIVNKTLELLK